MYKHFFQAHYKIMNNNIKMLIYYWMHKNINSAKLKNCYKQFHNNQLKLEIIQRTFTDCTNNSWEMVINNYYFCMLSEVSSELYPSFLLHALCSPLWGYIPQDHRVQCSQLHCKTCCLHLPQREWEYTASGAFQESACRSVPLLLPPQPE